MSDLKLYIPKSLAFQRVTRSALAAANQVDHGKEMNDAHSFALLEFFEFLASEQLTPLMGPGLAAELSAIIESEFSWASLGEQTPLHTLLRTHASMFAGLFCCAGEEPPGCYRRWLRFHGRSAPDPPCDRQACLMANFEAAMSLDRDSLATDSKLQLLKYRIAKRTAELLLATGFQPETVLRHMRQEDVPNSAEILAMHAFVLLKKNPRDLARLCAWSDESTETMFLHWASRDPFVRDTLVAFRWLNPVIYDQFPEGKSNRLGDHGGLLHSTWREGKTAPAFLARREPPWFEANNEPRSPLLLPKDVKPRFSPLPLMLIGGPAVGKTAFLTALAQHLSCAQSQLREGQYLESDDLEEIGAGIGNAHEAVTNSASSKTTCHGLLVRDEGDPEVARWMRLQLIDTNGEGVNHRTLSTEFLRNLRAARGLLFFVDDRSFPDLLPDRGVSSAQGNGHMEAAELAARFTHILQLYFDVNKSALHLPVGLVVNKAELLLRPANLLSLNPPSLIPEETKIELVHVGLGEEMEAAEPFERLRSCIRCNFRISRVMQNQRFVFELIERFRSFISAVLCHTYRFQIFLTCSAKPETESRERFPYGVWDVAKWLVNQLEPSYRVQTNDSVQHARIELEEMRNNLAAAVLRDHEARNALLKVIDQREKASPIYRMKFLNQGLERQAEHATEQMRTALQSAFALAELPPVTDEADPAPFPLRRRLAKEALERLEDQISYLTEWREQLSGVVLRALPPKQQPKSELRQVSSQLAIKRPTA